MEEDRLMILLAIDTFDITTGAALWKDGEITASEAETGYKNRDSDLSVITLRVLSRGGVGFKDVECGVLAKGPGSFTGLRVGTAYMKGLCYALKIPFVSVDSMEVLARCVGKQDISIIPVIHAKGDEVYFAQYGYKEGQLVLTGARKRGNYQHIREYLDAPAVFIGGGFLRHRAKLETEFGDKVVIPEGVKAERYAEEAVKLGVVKAEKGEFEDLHKFEPEYPEFK